MGALRLARALAAVVLRPAQAPPTAPLRPSSTGGRAPFELAGGRGSAPVSSRSVRASRSDGVERERTRSNDGQNWIGTIKRTNVWIYTTENSTLAIYHRKMTTLWISSTLSGFHRPTVSFPFFLQTQIMQASNFALAYTRGARGLFSQGARRTSRSRERSGRRPALLAGDLPVGAPPALHVGDECLLLSFTVCVCPSFSFSSYLFHGS